jgi:hypothetical protein
MRGKSAQLLARYACATLAEHVPGTAPHEANVLALLDYLDTYGHPGTDVEHPTSRQTRALARALHARLHAATCSPDPRVALRTQLDVVQDLRASLSDSNGK